METLVTKLIAAGILGALTLVTGLIVSRSGRPLNVGLVTLHKLIAVGSVVLVGLIVYQLLKTVDGRVLELTFTVISGILFLALIATGALLTREEMQLPGVVLRLHQILPLLAVASSTLTIFLLARGKA